MSKIKTAAKIATQIYTTCVVKGILTGIDEPGQQLRATRDELREAIKNLDSRVKELQSALELAQTDEEREQLLCEFEELAEQCKALSAASVRATAADALHESVVWAVAIKATSLLF